MHDLDPNLSWLVFAIIEVLSDGVAATPDELARRLNAPVPDVLVVLEAIENGFVTVDRLDDGRIRLPTPPRFLDREAVLAHLGADAEPWNLRIERIVDSTNTVMLANAAGGAPGFSALAAEVQTAGRGRRGRSFLSGIGSSLTFSVLWRTHRGAAALNGISLAAGLASARALHACGARDVMLKWPNDIMYAGAKLGGILVESQSEARGPSAVVIGIGINCALTREMRERVGRVVTDLDAILADPPPREVLLAEMLRHLHAMLVRFDVGGFRAMHEEWCRLDAYSGVPVVLSLPDGQVVSGIERGVSQDGSLVLDCPGGERQFAIGEISLLAGSPALPVGEAR